MSTPATCPKDINPNSPLSQNEAIYSNIITYLAHSPLLGLLVRENRRTPPSSLNRRMTEATIYLFKNLQTGPYKGFSFRLVRGVSTVTIFNLVGLSFERTFKDSK